MLALAEVLAGPGAGQQGFTGFLRIAGGAHLGLCPPQVRLYPVGVGVPQVDGCQHSGSSQASRRESTDLQIGQANNIEASNGLGAFRIASIPPIQLQRRAVHSHLSLI